MTAIRGLLVGLAAGAAGTTALNASTYVDMVVRARPSSSTPEDMVEKLSELTGAKVPGQGDERSNRVAGLGPLTGLITGLGIGAAMMLMAALMGLVFLSSGTGHDEAIVDPLEDERDRF